MLKLPPPRPQALKKKKKSIAVHVKVVDKSARKSLHGPKAHTAAPQPVIGKKPHRGDRRA